jgi:hypothetical protein
MIERTEQRLDPVEQPTLIELSINMQTARALDIVILDALFARAERVVE